MNLEIEKSRLTLLLRISKSVPAMTKCKATSVSLPIKMLGSVKLRKLRARQKFSDYVQSLIEDDLAAHPVRFSKKRKIT